MNGITYTARQNTFFVWSLIAHWGMDGIFTLYQNSSVILLQALELQVYIRVYHYPDDFCVSEKHFVKLRLESAASLSMARKCQSRSNLGKYSDFGAWPRHLL